MRKPPAIDLNTTYADAHAVWRVTKVLADGLHVVLVQVDDPSQRKTLSVWALADSRRFARRAAAAPAEASASRLVPSAA